MQDIAASTLSGLKVSAMTAAGAAATASSMLTGDLSVSLFGVSLSVLMAAFGGAAVSLSFVTLQRAWYITVGTGTVAGAYASPLFSHVFGLPHETLNGVAFSIALMLQIIVPAAAKWIERKGNGNA